MPVEIGSTEVIVEQVDAKPHAWRIKAYGDAAVVSAPSAIAALAKWTATTFSEKLLSVALSARVRIVVGEESFGVDSDCGDVRGIVAYYEDGIPKRVDVFSASIEDVVDAFRAINMRLTPREITGQRCRFLLTPRPV
jgi:hypothetical protein